MSRTIAEFARAKVNLALHVLGRRVDGYHDIDSIVAFADVADALVVTASPAQEEPVAITARGPFASGVPLDKDNLIWRAHALLSEMAVLPKVTVQLTKNLPVAAGIGGGSADAAAALRAFQQLAEVPVSADVLLAIALKLGADVPVCLEQTACRMAGVGERLSTIGWVPAPAIVLVNPGVPCATVGVFAGLGLAKGSSHADGLDPSRPDQWRNDLTAPAMAVQPLIADVIAALSALPELSPVRMSGSGATCFGLAQNIEDAQRAAISLARAHPDWWVVAAGLT